MASIGDLFGTQGRLGRLTYLFWVIGVQALCAGILYGVSYPLLARGGFTAGLGWWIFAVTHITGGLALVVLMGRRLHDLGQSAVHLLWIWPLHVAVWVNWEAGPPYSDAAIGLGLVSALVSIGLFLAPGQAGPNRYGPGRG